MEKLETRVKSKVCTGLSGQPEHSQITGVLQVDDIFCNVLNVTRMIVDVLNLLIRYLH